MKQIKKCLSFTFFAAVVCSVYISLGPAPPAYAAYDGGRLIDNNVFLDANSMNQTDIQNFLTSKGSALASRTFLMDCPLTTMSEPYYRSLGAPCGQYIPAAQIIYYAAQIYGINPKVVLATLQKEQSLITNPYPSSWNINQAMGYGCPTTGSCNDASGFLYQVDNGVWLLRYHMERARGNLSYWWQSTSWNPCGSEKNFYKPNLYPGQDVRFYDEDNIHYRTHYIANAATSSMYCYTPHAYNNPNGLYGKPVYGWAGRYYSGSYNFVYYYERWFGSTIGQDWSWESLGQTVYTDNSKQTVIGWNSTARSGTRVYVVVKVRNTGVTTWVRDNHWPQVQIGTWYPQDRKSAVCDSSTWLTCSRAATHNESMVAPGQIATFEFWAKTPDAPGNYGEAFNLAADGLTWMRHAGTYIQFQSVGPIYSWEFKGQTVYEDESRQKVLGWNASVTPGQRVYTVIQAKNTGNTTWYKSGRWPQVQIGTWYPQDHNSVFCDKTWLHCNRAATHFEDIVEPGKTATFGFWMQSPPSFSANGEAFNLVADGFAWMNPTGAYVSLDASKARYSWQVLNQENFTDQTKATSIGWNAQTKAGSRVYTVIRAKNTGSTTWYKSGRWPQVQIGTWYPQDRKSAVCDSSTWLTCSRAATHNESMVAPGQIATFEFWAKTPDAPGNYGEAFNLVADGLIWLNPTGLYVRYVGE